MARSAVTARNKFAVLEGLPQLEENIAIILDRSVGQEAKKIWMKAALVMRDKAVSLAPMIKIPRRNPRPWQVPGTLKAAIYAAYGDPEKPNVLVGVNYNKAPQAHWIEYGTANRPHPSGFTSGAVPAQPYMRPALAATRGEMIAIIAEGYRELITEAGK